MWARLCPRHGAALAEASGSLCGKALGVPSAFRSRSLPGVPLVEAVLEQVSPVRTVSRREALVRSGSARAWCGLPQPRAPGMRPCSQTLSSAPLIDATPRLSRVQGSECVCVHACERLLGLFCEQPVLLPIFLPRSNLVTDF